jgi:hypothetical protein
MIDQDQREPPTSEVRISVESSGDLPPNKDIAQTPSATPLNIETLGSSAAAQDAPLLDEARRTLLQGKIEGIAHRVRSGEHTTDDLSDLLDTLTQLDQSTPGHEGSDHNLGILEDPLIRSAYTDLREPGITFKYHKICQLVLLHAAQNEAMSHSETGGLALDLLARARAEARSQIRILDEQSEQTDEIREVRQYVQFDADYLEATQAYLEGDMKRLTEIAGKMHSEANYNADVAKRLLHGLESRQRPEYWRDYNEFTDMSDDEIKTVLSKILESNPRDTAVLRMMSYLESAAELV